MHLSTVLAIQVAPLCYLKLIIEKLLCLTSYSLHFDKDESTCVPKISFLQVAQCLTQEFSKEQNIN